MSRPANSLFVKPVSESNRPVEIQELFEKYKSINSLILMKKWWGERIETGVSLDKTYDGWR